MLSHAIQLGSLFLSSRWLLGTTPQLDVDAVLDELTAKGYDDDKLDALFRSIGTADSVTLEQLAAAGVPNRTVFYLRRRLGVRLVTVAAKVHFLGRELEATDGSRRCLANRVFASDVGGEGTVTPLSHRGAIVAVKLPLCHGNSLQELLACNYLICLWLSTVMFFLSSHLM